MTRDRLAGLTLVELMVALAITSFLIIGAMQVYTQSRQAFLVNESIARVQEAAQFAMDTIEADLRMAGNWGRTSRATVIEGRSIAGNPNPSNIPAIPSDCGGDWVLELAQIVDGDNNGYTLPCPPGTASSPVAVQPDSDSLTVRRVTTEPVPLEAGRVQIQSTRIAGRLFTDGVIPIGFSAEDSTTHNLLIHSYYVADDSNLVPGVPTLRRKTLGAISGTPAIIDQEIIPGIESLQIQFGIDVDEDNTIDRYVDPGDPIYDPQAVGFVPGARVMTTRVWMVARDIDIGAPDDALHRVHISKTILLRNART